MNVDYLSDIHIDFWVEYNAPEYVQEKQIEDFVSKIIPKTPSKILIIAGDIGHHNDQNLILFKTFKKYYDNIYFLEGNHDLYIISKKDLLKYSNNSYNRLKEMIEMSSTISGVQYLNGVVEIEGKKIGGFPMWYDNSYGVEVCGRSPIFMHQLWKRYMADSNYIHPKLDWLEYCELHKTFLKNNFEQCDLIFSHVSPDWSHLVPHYQNDPTSSFFHFDGREILKKCNGKTWVHGHTHTKYNHYTESGCHMLCNPFGYPGEKNFENFSINTLTI